MRCRCSRRNCANALTACGLPAACSVHSVNTYNPLPHLPCTAQRSVALRFLAGRGTRRYATNGGKRWWCVAAARERHTYTTHPHCSLTALHARALLRAPSMDCLYFRKLNDAPFLASHSGSRICAFLRHWRRSRVVRGRHLRGLYGPQPPLVAVTPGGQHALDLRKRAYAVMHFPLFTATGTHDAGRHV